MRSEKIVIKSHTAEATIKPSISKWMRRSVGCFAFPLICTQGRLTRTEEQAYWIHASFPGPFLPSETMLVVPTPFALTRTSSRVPVSCGEGLRVCVVLARLVAAGKQLRVQNSFVVRDLSGRLAGVAPSLSDLIGSSPRRTLSRFGFRWIRWP